jgi:hypothetical protein
LAIGYLAECQLADRHLANRHLERHLAERHLADRLLADIHLAERQLAIGHLAECQLAIGHLAECQLAIGHLAERQLAIGHLAERQFGCHSKSDLFVGVSVADSVGKDCSVTDSFADSLILWTDHFPATTWLSFIRISRPLSGANIYFFCWLAFKKIFHPSLIFVVFNRCVHHS